MNPTLRKILSTMVFGICTVSNAVLAAEAPASGTADAAAAPPGRVYGENAPFVPQDLPRSMLRSDLERLPAAIRKNALRRLHENTFPEADLEYLRVDKNGWVLYVDPLPAAGITQQQTTSSETESAADAGSIDQITMSITASKAFRLHSKPGASSTVYVNLVGETVRNTLWNMSSGHATLQMLPYSIDADYQTFSQQELDAIAEIWKGIAEDFAPFDVDVTTERPASFLANVGHVLVTPQTDRNGNAIINCFCGGVAYLDVWGLGPQFQPALVFTNGVGTGPKNIIEAASHEIGHNLSLIHDGTASVAYYQGHGSGLVGWAPIMGVGYYFPLSQWSQGEYSGANNTQDDLAEIATRLGDRIDDHEDTDFVRATNLSVSGGTGVFATTPVVDPDNLNPANKGTIEDRADIDLFRFEAEAGTVDLTVSPAWLDGFVALGQIQRASNLDVRATLKNSAGTVITRSNPANDTFARITSSIPAGTYILEVDGVARGSKLADGYSDYGSIGQYHINGRLPGTDRTPDPFVFAGKVGVARSSLIKSAPVTPVGYSSPATVSVFDGRYSIGCGATFVSVDGTISPGQSICVSHTSAASSGTSTTTRLDIGGVSATFTSKTAGPSISINPVSLAFGSQPLNVTTAAQVITLESTGSASLPLRGFSLSGANPDQFTSTSNCPASLPVGNQCTINVSFRPTTIGAKTGALIVRWGTGTGTVTAALSGSGGQSTAGSMSLTPGSLAFGNVSQGLTSTSQLVTVRNTGAVTLPLPSISVVGTHANQYLQSHDCPAQLPAAGSCSVTVRFRPTSAGTKTARLRVIPGAGAVTATVSLRGTGI